MPSLWKTILSTNADCISAEGKVPPPMRPSASWRWRSEMFEDGIPMSEWSLTGQSEWLRDRQHSILALTGQDGNPEEPYQINQLVISTPSTNVIVPTAFFKLNLWQTNTQHYFNQKSLEHVGWGSISLTHQYIKLSKLWANKRLILNRIIYIR